MNNVHGLIYANHTFPGLEALGSHRTGASLPFCGRYRLIDFALSGMRNAGVRNLGVIMQKGYQSLMEHLGNGRSWDLSRHSGGLHLLPPYGMPDADKGFYDGCMEALGAVYTYLKDIREEYILIARGDLCANVNMRALIDEHLASGADVTTVCIRDNPAYVHHSFVTDEAGYVTELLCCQEGKGRGITGLEMYILHREKLLELVRWCRETSRLHFHSDALNYALRNGWRIKTCLHEGYAVHITNVRDYYRANMDMLDPEKRAAAAQADEQPAVPEGSWVCSCGSINNGNFCPNCGAAKPVARKPKCGNCGWEADDAANPPKFCPNCGKPFGV